MPKINEEKKQLRRELIIQSSLECFSKNGYSKTSIDDIVKASGVSKGGIYTYFKSKDEIFKAIADNVLVQRKSILENLSDEISNAEKLKKYVSTVISNYNKNKDAKKRIRFSFEFWIENKDKKKLGDTSKRTYFNKRFIKAFKDIEEIIKNGQSAGEFSKKINTEAFIYILFASIDGMAFYTGILEKRVPVDSAEIMAEIFEKYLLIKK